MRTWSRQFCPERKTETERETEREREREREKKKHFKKKRGPCSLGLQKRYGLSSWIAFGLDTLWSLSLVENRNDIDSRVVHERRRRAKRTHAQSLYCFSNGYASFSSSFDAGGVVTVSAGFLGVWTAFTPRLRRCR